ncbi:MAG: hypothetical protein ABIQ52_17835 [Vicinamibacterales bacterium]
MPFHARAVVVSLALLLLAAAETRAGEAICSDKLPANIDSGMFASAILKMLSLSETFRDQCHRIAAQPALRVRLNITLQAADYRAVTVLARYEAGYLRAEVTLVFAENYVELVAHEFEHVLEQVDGIDLRAIAALGQARHLPDGSYETPRATLAGQQVWREYEALAADGGRRRLRWLR